ncbi:S8 family serine peptidase [Ruminiclostridium josui]|uniref:S8 family serine peptidase n=1 Tax=Ruminiclostridium josui TaxID=1499 RepID=UPI0004635AD7|nr:hypothetical protein [Ruminiclostridium josui]
MALRRYCTMVLLVTMLVVLLCQNCFAISGLTTSSAINYGGTVTASSPEIVPGQVIVSIKTGYESTLINDATLAELGVASVKYSFGSIWLFHLKNNSVQAVYDAIKKLTQHPYVIYAEPNFICHIC